MSEIGSVAYFRGEKSRLEDLANFVETDESYIHYQSSGQTRHVGKDIYGGDFYYADNLALGGTEDSFPNIFYEKISKEFSDISFVSFERYYNCDEYTISYSAAGSSRVEMTSEDESDWYEKILEATGKQGLIDLYVLAISEDEEFEYLFEDIPGFDPPEF